MALNNYTLQQIKHAFYYTYAGAGYEYFGLNDLDEEDTDGTNICIEKQWQTFYENLESVNELHAVC